MLEEIKPLIGKGFSQEWSIRTNSNPQFYTMHIASEMKKKYEIENNFTYDVVIKSRPDFLQVHNDIEKYFGNLKILAITLILVYPIVLIEFMMFF